MLLARMRSFPDSCGHSNAAREEQESVELSPCAVLGAKVKLWVLYSPAEVLGSGTVLGA